MRKSKIIIDFEDSEYSETLITASLVLETIKHQIEEGETENQGVTESGIKYRWELIS